jgi:hypothetical protein
MTDPTPTTAVATTRGAPSTLQLDAHGGGLRLRTIEDLRWFCEQAAKSGLIPEHFRGKPADVMIAVQWGYEIGVTPIQALNNIAVIKGRAMIWGDLVLGLLQARRDVIEYVLEDDLDTIAKTGRATCRIKRVGYPKETVVTYTREMAAKAGLLQKDTYRQHEPRMLQMRARAFCARNAAADLLKGLDITDDLREMEPRDVTEVQQPQAEEAGTIVVETTATRRVPRQPAEAAAPPPPEPTHDAPLPDDDDPQSEAQRALPIDAAAATPAPAAEAANPCDSSGYVPPVAPSQPTDRCTRPAKLRGKTIYTAGISNVTLMKVESFVSRFDAAHYPGAALDALDIVVAAGDADGQTPPDWFHLDEEQGRAFCEYLQTHMGVRD